MTFAKESEFEAAVIHELRQRGWGDAPVIKNPSEETWQTYAKNLRNSAPT